MLVTHYGQHLVTLTVQLFRQCSQEGRGGWTRGLWCMRQTIANVTQLQLLAVGAKTPSSLHQLKRSRKEDGWDSRSDSQW